MKDWEKEINSAIDSLKGIAKDLHLEELAGTLKKQAESFAPEGIEFPFFRKGSEETPAENGWGWLNESKAISVNQELAIQAPAHTDWFRNPIPTDGRLDAPLSNAPVFFREVTGDFVFRARVRPNFKTVYDACALMVIQDDLHWTKLAFEKTDFGTTAAVCVVTDEVSDDANGCDIAQDEIWLQLIRRGDVFAAHYSPDGKDFRMVRVFRLPLAQTVRVGLEAQSPAGDGGIRFFSDITLEKKAVENLRRGV